MTAPTTRRRTVARMGAAALALTLAAGACGGKQTNRPGTQAAAGTCEATPGQLSIATGNSTGVYYVLGGGIAKTLSSHTPLKATAAETGASVQNIETLVAGQYGMAFALADTAADAVAGKGAFKGPQPIKATARIYPNYNHVIVRKNSGIKSVADMKGKKISTGSPKSGTEVIAQRLFQAAGLKESDVQAQRLELGKTVDSMKDGSIDGFVWSGGLPTAAVTDLFTSQKDNVEFIDITPLLDKMKQINPVYDTGTIPKSTYNTPADIKTIVVPNVLVVKADMPDNNACAITKSLFDHKDELVKVHPSAKEINKDTAGKTDPIPLHPGSKKALDQVR